MLASKFSHGTAYEYDVVGAGASGDIGYIVGYQHTTASVGGADPETYNLRVTTIFPTRGRPLEDRPSAR